MVKMFKSEFIKVQSLRTAILLLIVFGFANAVCIIGVERQDIVSWKANAEKLYEEYDEALQECKKEGVEEELYKPFVEKVALIGYSLENDIPYGVTSVFSHMIRVTELLGLLGLFAVYLGSKVYSNEYDSHTWKNLFCTGVEKRNIYLTKIFFTITYMAAYIVLFLFMSAVVGLIYFGSGDHGIMLSYVNGRIIESNRLAEIVTIYGMSFIKLLFYVFLVHTCIIFTGKKLFSFLGAVVVMMAVPWVNLYFANSMILKFLPFRYLDIRFEGYNTELLRYFLVLIGYSILFLTVSYYKFVKTEWEHY